MPQGALREERVAGISGFEGIGDTAGHLIVSGSNRFDI
jgi:hypothetical protein